LRNQAGCFLELRPPNVGQTLSAQHLDGPAVWETASFSALVGVRATLSAASASTGATSSVMWAIYLMVDEETETVDTTSAPSACKILTVQASTSTALVAPVLQEAPILIVDDPKLLPFATSVNTHGYQNTNTLP